MTDPLLGMLADLPQASLDEVRSRRIKARCHAALARGRRKGQTADRLSLEPTLVAGQAGASAWSLGEVLRQMLKGHGVV